MSTLLINIVHEYDWMATLKEVKIKWWRRYTRTCPGETNTCNIRERPTLGKCQWKKAMQRNKIHWCHGGQHDSRFKGSRFGDQGHWSEGVGSKLRFWISIAEAIRQLLGEVKIQWGGQCGWSRAGSVIKDKWEKLAGEIMQGSVSPSKEFSIIGTILSLLKRLQETLSKRIAW